METEGDGSAAPPAPDNHALEVNAAGAPMAWDHSRLNGHSPLPYQWDVTGGTCGSGNSRPVMGFDALTDNLGAGVKFLSYGRKRNVGQMQLQAVIRALSAVLGGTPQLGGTVQELRDRAYELRTQVLLKLQADAQVAADAQMVAQALQQAQDASAQVAASGGGPPPAAVPPPLSAPVAHSAFIEIQRTRVRQSERWAAEWLLSEGGLDGDELRRPCPVPLLEGVPFGCRDLVISRYCKAIQDLEWAVENREAHDTGEALKREIGAWVIVLRIFPMTILRDQGGGGHRGSARARATVRAWDQGDYAAATLQARRKRAERRAGADTTALDKLFKRVTKYCRQGKISRAAAALTAPAQAAGSAETLATLQHLSPAQFVPDGCVRRERNADRVQDVRRRVTFKAETFAEMIRTMPKSAATWATTGLMKAAGRTRLGLKRLKWLCERIANAEVPDAVRPLLFDSRRVALEKSSQHQQSITRLLEERDAQLCPMCPTSSGRSGFPAPSAPSAPRAPAVRCARCGYDHPATVSCAPAIWAGEHPDRVPTGSRRQPTAHEVEMGRMCLERPHPRLACTGGPGGTACAACLAAPEREVRSSADKRPIDIPAVEMKLTERAMQFEERGRLGPGFMPTQVGVAVPGGLSMLTAAVEGHLRLNADTWAADADPVKLTRKLDEDLFNCFGEICRTGLLEDVLDSEEIVEVDLSHWAPYVEMAYGGGTSAAPYGGWFKMDDGTWAFLRSHEGIRQGAPLGPTLACLTLVRPQKAAQAAMDAYHGLDRDAGTTVGERVAAHVAAAEKSLVGGLLDDSALTGALGSLPHGHYAYHRAVIKRNGATVPKKAVLSGPWYRRTEAMPAPGSMEEEAAAAAGGAEVETAQRERRSGEQTTGQGGREPNSSPGAGLGQQHVALSSVVSIWPGVFVNRATRGQVWLGVPFGDLMFVPAELRRQIMQQDRRLRSIAAYASATAAGGMHRGVSLVRQNALSLLRYSANARDVHFLRSLSPSAVRAGGEMFDCGIEHTLAVIMGQAPAPGSAGEAMCERAGAVTTPSFRASAARLRLATEGVNVRRWAPYSHAAHVGMWAQAWSSSQLLFGDQQVCAYPALASTIELAADFDDDRSGTMMQGFATHGTHYLAAGLAEAWQGIVATTQDAYPAAAQRAAGGPANWLVLTGERVRRLGLMRGKVQKLLSKAVSVVVHRETEAFIHEDRSVGYAERLDQYKAAQQSECSAVYHAQPWIDDGDMHVGSSEFLDFTALRFCLDMRPGGVPRRSCPCSHGKGAGWRGKSLLAREDSDDARLVNAQIRREWARHALTCVKGGGRRAITHDQIRDIWIVLLENAGYRDVEEEPQWWDVAAAAGDADHRRPDIVCRHPKTAQRFVLDVVCWWGASAGYGAQGGAVAATRKEAWKRRRYRRAMWAKLELGMSAEEAVAWAESEQADPRATEAAVDAAVAAAGHTFVPLGFEANGSWGQRSLDFFGEVVEQAGFNASAELYHWCAMVFGAHWRQRIGVALARGQAVVVSSAADKGRLHGKEIKGKRGASAEFSTTDCRPCAPLE